MQRPLRWYDLRGALSIFNPGIVQGKESRQHSGNHPGDLIIMQTCFVYKSKKIRCARKSVYNIMIIGNFSALL
jgi:hypothetical protein